MTPTTESSIDLIFKQAFEKWPKNLERQKPLRVPEIVPGTFHTKIWNGTCMLFNVCGHFWHYYLGTVDPEGCTSRAPIRAGTFHVVPLGGISGTISLVFERVFEKKRPAVRLREARMMRNIKAIPTIHRGLNVRSRLEARLAEMFSQLGLELVLRASGLRRLDPGLRYRPRLQAGPGRREAIYVLRRGQ